MKLKNEKPANKSPVIVSSKKKIIKKKTRKINNAEPKNTVKSSPTVIEL